MLSSHHLTPMCGLRRYYCNLTRPGQLQAGDNYFLFRGALVPAQHTILGGGCWTYRLKRQVTPASLAALGHAASPSSPSDAVSSESAVNRLWEKLLLSLVGETIGEPCVVGAGVSVRRYERVISIWCKAEDAASDAATFRRVGAQLDTFVFGDVQSAKTKGPVPTLEWKPLPQTGSRRA